MNDQKAKGDAGKPKLSLVPRQIIFDIARIREYGNNKYPEGGVDNWKKVEPERYRDAAFRHFLAYLDDPYGVDKESGLPHLWHLACNIAFLCEMEDSKMEKPLHWNHTGPIIAKVINPYEPKSGEPHISNVINPYEPKLGESYTNWQATFEKLDGNPEFYRWNITNGDIQFGDWNEDHTKIIPRKDSQ
jgi:hypothetical protein